MSYNKKKGQKMKKAVLIGISFVVFVLSAGIASAKVYFSFAIPAFAFGFGGPAV